MEAPKEEQPVAQRGNWMSLEEIEGMERRLRRLLETPTGTAPPRPAKHGVAPYRCELAPWGYEACCQ